MNDRQRYLARFALGLMADQRRSYRNRFCATPGSRDDRDWRAMVDVGLALRYPWGWSRGDLYTLTRAGAESVLEPRETLDPEDF